MITVSQYVETLPDQQVTEALRKRVDWKYALQLPLNSPGMDAGLLCDFRKKLLAEPAARGHMKSLLNRLSLAVRSNREQLSSLQPDQGEKSLFGLFLFYSFDLNRARRQSNPRRSLWRRLKNKSNIALT